MSTRCRIGLTLPDGKIKSIYCHWDGYPDGVGKELQKHYNDPKKIEKLLELGDISSLGDHYDEELSKMDWKMFDEKDLKKRAEIMDKCKNCTVAFKDRGDNSPARVDEDELRFIQKQGLCWEDYAYLFKKDYDGIWKWFYIETPYFQVLEERS